MDEQEILNPKNGGYLGIIITEAVVTAVILLYVIAVKYFFKGTYPSLKEWYNTNICAETDVGEVIETAGGGADEV